MNKENYTSLELSKWLQEKGFKGESEWYWVKWSTGAFVLVDKGSLSDLPSNIEKYPAYDILNDLCVKYAKEIFGGDKIEDDEVDFEYSSITRIILSLLQQDKKEEAEKYLWDNCLFNPKNK